MAETKGPDVQIHSTGSFPCVRCFGVHQNMSSRLQANGLRHWGPIKCAGTARDKHSTRPHFSIYDAAPPSLTPVAFSSPLSAEPHPFGMRGLVLLATEKESNRAPSHLYFSLPLYNSLYPQVGTRLPCLVTMATTPRSSTQSFGGRPPSYPNVLQGIESYFIFV